MKLSREYITERLKNTSVHELAVELTDEMAEAYKGRGIIDRNATIAKFEKMSAPFAPKTVTATDVMQSMGVKVVRG